MSHLRVAALLLAACALLTACGDDEDERAQPQPDPSPSAVQSTSWPMLGHDHRSSFYTEDAKINVESARGLRVAWTFDAGAYVASTPAVADGVVYIQSPRGTFALDAATGAERWRNAAVGGTSSPTIVDGELYVNDGGSVLHRLDPASGEELWRAAIDPHPAAAGFSSPVVAGELVIVGSASVEEVSAAEGATFRGGMVAFDRDTGAERWRHYTVEPPYNGASLWSTVSIDDERGLVYGTTANNYTEEASTTSDSIFALRVETGEPVWTRQLTEGDVFTIPNPRGPDYGFGTNPILFEAMVDGEMRALLGAGQKSGMFWVLDRATGEVVWSRQVSGGSALIGGVFNNGAYDGERIIVAGNNGTSDGAGSEPSNGRSRALGAARTTTSVLMAIDPSTGDILWERQLPAWVWGPITIAGDVGFVSADNTIQAFDVRTGEKLAQVETEGTIASGASIANGYVYFGSGLAYLGTTNGTKVYALSVE
jgi:polyvinyl alcohol dehydrogenase (cytochrome)